MKIRNSITLTMALIALFFSTDTFAQAWQIDAVEKQIFTNGAAPDVNVGIRTTEPSEALEVIGNSLLRGMVGVNSQNPTAELAVNGQMYMSTIGFGTSTQDKISLYSNRLGMDNMVGFGFETETIIDGTGGILNARVLYSKAENRHRWYVGSNADGGLNASMTLNANRLGLHADVPEAALHVNALDASTLMRLDNLGTATFVVRDNGWTGIGTGSPLADLHIIGEPGTAQILLTPDQPSANGTSELLLGEDDDFTYGMALRYDGSDNRFYIMGNSVATPSGPHLSVERDQGDVGIGFGSTTVPSGFKTAIAGDVLIRPDLSVFDGSALIMLGEDEDNGLSWRYDGVDNKLYLDGHTGGTDYFNHLSIERTSGDVAIGYGDNNVPAGYKLAVDGALICEEVRVEMSEDWPDYVFAKDYQLTDLRTLSAQIEANGHLPGIPSADDIRQNGLELGQMQHSMMEKIEELTLYVIELQEQIDALQNSK